MKQQYDQVSAACSKLITKKYSTSFSLGINLLDRRFHDAIYGIYGFVRLADEIADSFHNYDKKALMSKFRNDTVSAIEDRISLNPVLNSFQFTVHNYKIEWTLIDTFLKSMEMDLSERVYDRKDFDYYILGSAEVVGLMCLRVFTEGNSALYDRLKPSAMRLGAAFQKVNFLRDAGNDLNLLGRTYFPQVNLNNFSTLDKIKIETEISEDFKEALRGIRELPNGARRGVYLAYLYYLKLFFKIRKTPPSQILQQRIRIPNTRKISIMFNSLIRHQLNLL